LTVPLHGRRVCGFVGHGNNLLVMAIKGLPLACGAVKKSDSLVLENTVIGL
jgi:hypothetical protein